ncbi:glycoside hydrolase family 61 protein [Thozetella sp. PMI_491]|nr:glycoside hydrolase family 61 protein [Thozetella sp. PMI_491]
MLFSSLVFASTVAAHGAVTSYVIAGKKYPGYDAYNTANSQKVIQRPWPGYNPITSCADANLRCNGGRSAAENATVMPGDKVGAIWKQWTHSQGPIMVWMYKCAGAFSACDGSGAGWFKIDEAGFHGDSGVFLDAEKGSGWDIAKLVGGDKQWTSTIPASLAAGNYLIRHELIALHQANAPQFYPECAQITVGGSGTAEPDASYKAAIPGYCKQSDANIRVPINNHTMPQTYTVPGPPVWKGAAVAKRAQEFKV